jgi:hypothetical protein
MVPIGNGEQTPMGASAITPATGLAGAAASPKNTGISPMRGVNLSPASPHITGQKLLTVPKPVQEEDDDVDDVDEDGDADDDTHDFSFINAHTFSEAELQNIEGSYRLSEEIAHQHESPPAVPPPLSRLKTL